VIHLVSESKELTLAVITIIGFDHNGIIITAGGGPNHEAIGFRFWNETGGFVQYARHR